MQLEIGKIGQESAHQLAPLIAAYAQEMRRGAPRRPDEYYAELLLADPTAELLGAHSDNALVGFAIYFDLPETITGHRAGQLDDLYVAPGARDHGVARRMIEALVEIGRAREWAHLRWLVPETNAAAIGLYERVAKPAPWKSYVIPIIERD
ncbi:N-acetyltransferase family protein [Amorphus sp. 3PC139-8]|uniref:GNAT family N-acetyltransferase n=1 Tax=Amorphus sp. 3PC139-8 TaxID=2735676 RepID=UPI00345D4505